MITKIYFISVFIVLIPNITFALSQKEEMSNIVESVRSVCQMPSNQSSYWNIRMKGSGKAGVKLIGSLSGEAEFSEGEWSGVQKVLKKHQKDDSENYRECARELTPIFVDKFTENQEDSGKPPIFVSQRIALVIGNSDYIMPEIFKNTRGITIDSTTTITSSPINTISALKNPINDAKLIIERLESKNFKIISGFDLNKKEMIKLIEKFQMILSTGGTGVFYYAGHAANINKTDYMLPINARNVTSEESFIKESVNVTELLKPIEKIIKNHPKNTGAAIIYAAARGNPAFDGEGNNSPFAKSLAKSIEVSKANEGIFDIFVNVVKGVKNKTIGKQIPWFSSSTTSDFYFSNQSFDKNISLMKILFIDACRDNPFLK